MEIHGSMCVGLMKIGNQTFGGRRKRLMGWDQKRTRPIIEEPEVVRRNQVRRKTRRENGGN
jgi:hypothetical protein